MSSTTLDAKAVIQKISEEAPALSEIRVINKINVGQGIRQGDIYLVRINSTGETVVKSGDSQRTYKIDAARYTKEGKDQLVPGFTMGSNHAVKQTDSVKVWIDPTNTNSLIGPVIKATERFTVTHPQHAHFDMPAGDYQVFYQLNPINQQRVRD